MEAGLNLKQSQLGWHRMDYLGFQVSMNLGVSDGYCEKLEQVTLPTLETRLRRILELWNYVRDHVPNYQKCARLIYIRLKKDENPGEKIAQK